jgi:hypothetical protein
VEPEIPLELPEPELLAPELPLEPTAESLSPASPTVDDTLPPHAAAVIEMAPMRRA